MEFKGLEINLTTKSVKVKIIGEEILKKYLGGKGVGIYLFYKYLETLNNINFEALSEINPFIVVNGVFTGSMVPSASKFVAISKSPLTNILASSTCGGNFGKSLKSIGYDFLVIYGRLKNENVIIIQENEIEPVKFKNIPEINGKTIPEVQKYFKLSPLDGDLTIGPAGENLVKFSNIASNERFLGRAGFGAIFGFKNIKSIIVKGKKLKFNIKDKLSFNKYNKKAISMIKNNKFISVLYKNYGTSSHVNLSNKGKILPVNNFKKSFSIDAKNISGENFKKRYGSVYHGCKPCIIQCGHKTKFLENNKQIPEYESIALLGSNTGVFDPEALLEFNRICNEAGLDTISAGNTIGWWIEAANKGFVNDEIEFGDTDKILKLLNDIINRENNGKYLAEGVKKLSEIFGGKEFAIHIKGLEISGYHPSGAWGQALAYAVANRGGCHLSAAIFPLEVYFNFLLPMTDRAKPQFVHFFENLFSAINSTGLCLFDSYGFILEQPLIKYTPKLFIFLAMQYLPEIAIKMIDLSIFARLYTSFTGIKISSSDFIEAGKRIHILERYINTLWGVSKKDDKLPDRFLKEEIDGLPAKFIRFNKMLLKYYKIRGYDLDGIPTDNTLKRFGISKIIKNSERYLNRKIKIKKSYIKTFIIKIFLKIILNAVSALSTKSLYIKKYIKQFPEKYKILFLIKNIESGVEKRRNGFVFSKNINEYNADLVLYFKDIDSAFQIFTLKKSIFEAFAEHRIYVKGDISLALNFTRILISTQRFIFPEVFLKRVVNSKDKINVFEKLILRIYLYLIGNWTGI